jgi:hypothetical protein
MKFDNIIVMTLFVVAFFITGTLGGLAYFGMNVLESEILKVNFDLPLAQNSTNPDIPNVTTFQEVLNITIHPLFNLGHYLPYLIYFMLFAYIIGLAMVAYMSSKNPVFFIVHLLFTIILTYFALMLSNTYFVMLEEPLFNSMMVEFVIFHRIMTYLPQVFFLTSLVFAAISFVNLMKPQTANNPMGFNYGEDF